MSDKKRIYTCTPLSFSVNDKFWIRDTGLICRSLRALGVESKCIVGAPAHEDDEDTDYVLRATVSDMSRVSWWKALHLDGVVLYSWGLFEFISIARAIHAAGIRLSSHWDGGGDLVPPPHPFWLKHLFIQGRFRVADCARSKHLSYADAITISPTVRDFFNARVAFRCTRFAEKCVDSPCPVSPEYRYEGKEKEKLTIAIGRWDDEEQKRQHFLMKTLESYYEGGGDAATEIYGTMTPELQSWHAALPDSVRSRIALKGYLENRKLKEVYNRARCIVCSSTHESSHIVSAEALCCGCSVVTTNRPRNLSVLHWYTTRQSGIIAENDSPEALAKALREEHSAWEEGKRNPAEIAAAWQPHFHADKVYTKIFNLN